MTPEMEAGWRVVTTPWVTLQVPDDWADLDPAAVPSLGADRGPADAIAAAPDEVPGRFRPNVVVTSSPADEPVEALSARLADETRRIEGWSRLLAVDLWPYAGVPGRRHEFFYSVGGGVVLVTTHLLALPGRRLDVTFSRGIEDAVHLRGLGAFLGSSIAARQESVA